jgi:hypothetical protein
MLSSGKCLRCIAPVAAMVDNFSCNQKNNNKTQFLSSKPMVDLSKKAKQFRNLKRTLYSRHQCNKLHIVQMWNTMIQAEELSYILSYQM